MMNSGIVDNNSLHKLDTVRWYAALVKSCCERSTRDKLEKLDLNIETYVPTQRVLKLYCDRRKWVDVVVIPCFVFIGLKDEKTSLSELCRLPYIHRFLKAPGDKGYTPIPNYEFDRMRDFISRAEKEVSLEPTRFTKGSIAHIYRGPFHGCDVMVISDDGGSNAKIGVELELFGRTLCTTIAKSDLMSDIEWRTFSKRNRKS